MIYTENTCKAMRLAYKAHHGQTDANGIPYIFHPIHLAEQMPDETTTCIALLHDVVEDTSVTLEELAELFPPEVVEAVGLMTHDPAAPYFEYVEKLAKNPLCRIVKRADLAHNTDPTRRCNTEIPEATLARWANKYSRAKEILDAAEKQV